MKMTLSWVQPLTFYRCSTFAQQAPACGARAPIESMAETPTADENEAL